VNRRKYRAVSLVCGAVLLLGGASDCGSGDSKAKTTSSPKVSTPANAGEDRCTTYHSTLKRYGKKNRKVKDLNLQNKNAADMYRELAEVFPKLAADLRKLAGLYDQAYKGTMNKAEKKQASSLEQQTSDSFARYCPGE
jgi:hypothetical protein